MKNLVRCILVHPLIFSIYPILFLYAGNIDQVDFIDVIPPGLISLVVFSLVFAISWLVFKKSEKSSFFTSAAIFLFYSYSAICNAIQLSLIPYDVSRSSVDAWLPGIWLAAFFLLTVFVYFSEVNDKQIAFLNVIALSLIFMVGVDIARFHFFSNGWKASGIDTNNSARIDAAGRPDIYFIILDCYAREDVLKEKYNFDNQSFLQKLREKNFKVVEKGFANYNQTYMSLASTLNFSYLDEVGKKYYDRNTAEPLVEMMHNNRLFKTLKGLGYKTVSFATGYTGTEMRKTDFYISQDKLNREFINLVLNTTYLAAFKLSFFDLLQLQIDIHRNRINTIFSKTPEIATMVKEPFVAFVHIICPHPPFVFDENGAKVPYAGIFDFSDGDHWDNPVQNYRENYLKQLKYTNEVTLTMIDRLLNDGRKKVIVLQSDHGPGFGLKWASPEESDIKERMANLQAFYFEDGDYSAFSQNHTPVNTFRIILNKFFGTDLELLENKVYFSRWWGRYRFIDVSGQLLD